MNMSELIDRALLVATCWIAISALSRLMLARRDRLVAEVREQVAHRNSHPRTQPTSKDKAA